MKVLVLRKEGPWKALAQEATIEQIFAPGFAEQEKVKTFFKGAKKVGSHWVIPRTFFLVDVSLETLLFWADEQMLLLSAISTLQGRLPFLALNEEEDG